MKMLNYKPTQLARSSRGFSLVELMVALALGLVMIGAVVTVFVSNQQSANIKQELDRAQEAFRFASHTIMRVVQQGEIQEPNTTLPIPELLVVNISPGEGNRDCLGRLVPGGIDHVRNTFTIATINDVSSLRCRVDPTFGAPPPDPPDVVIATGIRPCPPNHNPASDPPCSEFRFGIPDPGNAANGYWSDNALWVLPPGIPPINWTNVRSVRIRLAMQSEGGSVGPTAIFSATMRCGGHDNC